jgi:hypothetical protein
LLLRRGLRQLAAAALRQAIEERRARRQDDLESVADRLGGK